MSLIKDKIRNQPMFRFDHHFRSRTESELNKRLQSLYKLLEKEKDHAQLGFDNEMFRENKKKVKKVKQEKKGKSEFQEMEQISEGESEDEELNKIPKKKKKGNEMMNLGSEEENDD